MRPFKIIAEWLLINCVVSIYMEHFIISKLDCGIFKLVYLVVHHLLSENFNQPLLHLSQSMLCHAT